MRSWCRVVRLKRQTLPPQRTAYHDMPPRVFEYLTRTRCVLPAPALGPLPPPGAAGTLLRTSPAACQWQSLGRRQSEPPACSSWSWGQGTPSAVAVGLVVGLCSDAGPGHWHSSPLATQQQQQQQQQGWSPEEQTAVPLSHA
jgi:hypothetical protein